MDDQQTYLLNGLLTRNFGLGRILRFRQVARGRQAQTFELLTHQHHEYTVYLYPPTFAAHHLNFIAQTINTLDQQRFSVVPMLPAKSETAPPEETAPEAPPNTFTAEGPQNTTMLVSLTTTGSAIPPTQHTTHDISQLGLRLAWLHRLLREQIPAPIKQPSRATQLADAINRGNPAIHNFPKDVLQTLLDLLSLQTPQGWAHGDIQPAALLLDSDHQLRTVVDFALLHHASPHIDLIDALLTLCLADNGNLHPLRAQALLESYASLSPLRGLPWTPIVAHWLAHHLLSTPQKPLPPNFQTFLHAPENLATAIASHI